MFSKGSGWVKLHRSILEWEWYSDMPVRVLFIHLFLTANHRAAEYRGITIKRGQAWTSVKRLSAETGLSEKQVRNSLKKLEKTQEIEHKGASNGAMITVCKYDTYQSVETEEGEQRGKRGANKGQARGERGAIEGRQTRIREQEEEQELENDKEEKKKEAAFAEPIYSIHDSENLNRDSTSIIEHPKKENDSLGATDVQTLKSKSKTQKSYADPDVQNSANSHVNNALKEFILFRRRDLRKPLTQKSLDMMLNSWRESGFSPSEVVAALNTSVMSGWTGVFPKKALKDSNNAKPELAPKEIDYSEGLPTKKKN